MMMEQQRLFPNEEISGRRAETKRRHRREGVIIAAITEAVRGYGVAVETLSRMVPASVLAGSVSAAVDVAAAAEVPAAPIQPPAFDHDLVLDSFINEHLECDSNSELRASMILKAFQAWHRERYPGATQIPNQHRLGKRLGQRFFKLKQGVYKYQGVGFVKKLT
jgi:hypothetical protein